MADHAKKMNVMRRESCTILFWLAALLLFGATGSAPGQSVAGIAATGSAMDIDVFGNLFVLDASKGIITEYRQSHDIAASTGGLGWEDGRFDSPSGIWARNGIDVYIADEGNHRIQRFDRGLNFVSSFSTHDADDPAVRFGYPRGVAVSRHGELFILDGENQRVVKVDRTNTVERTFGGFDAGKGRLSNPRGIQVGPRDRVYVLDGQRIVQYDAFGNFVGVLPLGDDPGLSCVFADDYGVVVAGKSGIYWFDANGQTAGITELPADARPAAMITGLAVRGRTAYLLTPKGVVPVQAPDGWTDQQ
jgi:hypothetical protein